MDDEGLDRRRAERRAEAWRQLKAEGQDQLGCLAWGVLLVAGLMLALVIYAVVWPV